MSLLWGLGLAACNLSLAFVVPDSVPRSSVSLPFLLLTKWITGRWLQPSLDEHRAAGGIIASWWEAVGWGLAAMICIFAIIFGVMWLIAL